ncbi:MAG: DUF3108 domain-containing protein [Acidobacteriia bacterium]|nr:DUF3108 domain-containing protein [Terriglobia bacterium]
MPWLSMRMPMVLLLVCAGLAFPQTEAFPARETFSYNIEWRLISAGKATVDWHPSAVNGRPGWQVSMHAESAGLVSKLYKVDIESVSSLTQAFCAASSETSGREGSRRRETTVTFDGEEHKALYRERDLVKNTVLTTQEVAIPECVHDVLGGLFYLRTLDLEPGQSTEVPISDGKKSVTAKVEAQQREEIKVPEGAYKTVRYEIYLFNNVLYRRPAHLYVWLTDDRRKLPVEIRVRLQIAIGTITLQLAQHEIPEAKETSK